MLHDCSLLVLLSSRSEGLPCGEIKSERHQSHFLHRLSENPHPPLREGWQTGGMLLDPSQLSTFSTVKGSFVHMRACIKIKSVPHVGLLSIGNDINNIGSIPFDIVNELDFALIRSLLNAVLCVATHSQGFQ